MCCPRPGLSAITAYRDAQNVQPSIVKVRFWTFVVYEYVVQFYNEDVLDSSNSFIVLQSKTNFEANLITTKINIREGYIILCESYISNFLLRFVKCKIIICRINNLSYTCLTNYSYYALLLCAILCLYKTYAIRSIMWGCCIVWLYFTNTHQIWNQVDHKWQICKGLYFKGSFYLMYWIFSKFLIIVVELHIYWKRIQFSNKYIKYSKM